MTFHVDMDTQATKWVDLFGKDTTQYQVVLREGNDITHTYYTGHHVDCLLVMRDILQQFGKTFDENYGVDLLNTETGRLMSWTIH